MNENDSSSESAMDTTSTSAPKSDAELTEDQYLQRQADEALAALKQTAAHLAHSVGQGMDLRPVMRRHPWAAVGSAAAVGFVAAFVGTSRRRKPKPSAPTAKTGNGKKKTNGKKEHGLLWSLGKEVIDMARPAVMSAVTAAVSSQAAANGHDGHYPAGESTSPASAI